ncbi:general stress protein [Planococcus sp. APC 3906]|uniref:general stress protein n=1 Tax=Planococcus sp. APC 3906 TaxID=3035194 RepID=UPI0025B5352E|nr:general stress protein [Planococcus sp. APC 3906]MDN3450569.1 general stress protein [Planococcus sp. APC 3906]
MSRMVGSYNSENEAIRAIEDLKTQGYRSEDISVLSKDKGETKHVTEKTGTHAGEGAATGALTGGALGGLGGVLAGIGALAIPGIGPIVAAGPIVAGLTGAAAGAGVGGLAGALIGAGIPEDEAKEYEGHFNDGAILVMVNDSKSAIPDSSDRDRFADSDRNSTLSGDRTVIGSDGDVRHERGQASETHAGHRSTGRNDHDLFDDEARTAGLGSNRDLLDGNKRSSGLGSDEGLLHDTRRRSGSDNSYDRDPLIGGENDTTIRGDRDSHFDDSDDPSKRGRAGL